MDRRSFLKTSMLATSGARVAAWLANPVPAANAGESQRALPDEGPVPDLGGAVTWLRTVTTEFGRRFALIGIRAAMKFHAESLHAA
jgi:hypothetical protein